MSLWTRREFIGGTVGTGIAIAAGACSPMSTRYGMLNRVTTKPGQRDAVVQILLSGARLQGAMPGCELTSFTRRRTTPI